MALGARPYVQLLLLQSACTSMCHHMYDWNIVNCDVKQPIHLTPQTLQSSPFVLYSKLSYWQQLYHIANFKIINFEAVFSFICGCRRVAVARYRFICFVLVDEHVKGILQNIYGAGSPTIGPTSSVRMHIIVSSHITVTYVTEIPLVVTLNNQFTLPHTSPMGPPALKMRIRPPYPQCVVKAIKWGGSRNNCKKGGPLSV